MATNSLQLQETILKAIDAVVTQRNNDLKLDKTITGTIKKNIGTKHGNPLYQVEYGGGIIEAIAQNTEDMYSPHTGVYVLVPQGNFSNEKIIIGRASSILTDRSSSVVAAAVNSYSIIGANLLESTNDEKIKDKKFGLHSFHPKFRDEDHGIDHRAQFVYQKDRANNSITFSDDRLNIYKEQATAIMVKADFLTNLDIIQKQQPNARYGLIFNFAFDNLNKGYGETNGEILENVSKIVRGNVVINEQGDTENKLLYDFIFGSSDQSFEKRLENSQNDDITVWTNDNAGIIDQTSEQVQSLYDCFKVDDAKLDKEIINNTIQAFLALLNELKYKKNIFDIAQRYNEWKLEVVGDEPQKYIQFVLSSDDMIGNPFNFNTWNTQYAVFNIDLENFNHLDSILFYKEGFFEDTKDTNYEYQWPIGVDDPPQPDIFVKNLQIYAMNPLDNQSGDYTLNVEPYADSDIFVSGDNPSTQFKATLLRKLYEDLTANGKTSFLWFKEDSSVINSSSTNYHYLGGSGWRKLDHNETNYLFTTTVNDNYAYKNNYKCVAIYEPSADDKTILSFTFSVYNKDMAIDIKLDSDLGTSFSFDAGTPLIRVLINEDREDPDSEYEELGYDTSDENPPYIYCWTIDDATNGYTLFLDEIFNSTEQEESSAQEAIIISSKQNLLKRIKTYIGEELTDEPSHATRIKYPVSISSTGFTVTCYVKQNKNGKYYDIGSASLEFENKNESVAAGYRIYIVNGDQVFQYDEYGVTPCSEKKKDPLVIKPLQAKLFTPSGLEVEGTNYQIEWIFPIENTMIQTSEELRINPSTQLVQSYVGPEVNFSINDLYDPDAYANQITCHIHFGDVDYYKDTNFYFGKQGNNGTNGTDTVAKIEYAGEDRSNILHYQPLTLYVQKSKDKETQAIIAKGMLNIGARELKESITLAKTTFSPEEETETPALKLSVYQKETLIGSDSYKQGYPKWNIAGNANETTNNTSKFFKLESDLNGMKLIWDYNHNNNKDYLMQNIRAAVQLKDEQMYYAFFSLPIIEYADNSDLTSTTVDKLLSINRISIDKTYYLNEIVYNADGRNPIYNHNQGLRLYNIPSNITNIIWTAKGGLTENEDNPWFSLLEKKGDIDDQFEFETIPQDNASMIYVLPKDIFDGSATNNRIEAKLYDNETLIATVYAPINMTLNTFGLASLNAWDGNTVTIDEDGGYIMAPQIGAGEKDNNNRFTGILMGKTETYTGGGDNEKQIGLFGYANGLQSIFLDSETGNATFGLPDVDSEWDDEENKIIYKNYHNTNRQGSDDYSEGRIELRPGAESKIGGWRLGRKSIYYTTKPTNTPTEQNPFYEYIYDGTIGSPYSGDLGTPNRINYGAHHIKDIKTEDGGLLLSADPPYISIKGQRLTGSEIDNGINSQLIPGDSLEIQLDPQTPTLFTIFRHNADTRKINPRQRQFLAGINDKGELLANGVGKEDGNGTGTKSGNIILKAFKDTKDDIVGQTSGSYVGSVFEAGDGLASTRTFFQIFREKENPLSVTSQVYMTGGQTTTSGEFVGESKDEYLRPISIHGQKIMLYARTGSPNEYVEVKPGKGTHIKKVLDNGSVEYIEVSENGNYVQAGYDWVETDANIKITTDDAQIQLGNNTQLYLNRNANQTTNILKTSGPFNWDVGTEQTRKNLNINAAGLTENYSSISQKVTGTTEINNDKKYNINAKGNIELYRKYTDTTKTPPEDKIHSQLTLTDGQATFGFSNSNNLTNNSLITINKNNYTTNWTTTNHNVNISVNTRGENDNVSNLSEPKLLTISSQGIGTGRYHTPNENSQLTIYAGNLTDIKKSNNETKKQAYTKMTFNTSNNNWVMSGQENVSKFESTNPIDYSPIGGHWKTDGVPFEVAVHPYSEAGSGGGGSIGIHTNTINPSDGATPTRFYNFLVNMGQRISGGLTVTGGITTEHNSGLADYGIWSVKNIGTEGKIIGINNSDMICDGSSQGVSGGGTQALGNSFTISAPKITLQSSGRPKIEKDSISFTYTMPSYSDVGADRAGAANDALTAAKQYAKELFDSIDLSVYVTKTTYNNHYHAFTPLESATTSDGKSVNLHWSSSQSQNTSTPR